MKTICAVIVGALAVAGCSKAQPEKKAPAAPPLAANAADDASETNVLVEVCGKRLTVGMLERRVAMMKALQTHRNPKYEKKAMEVYLKKLRVGYPAAFAQNEMLADYARKTEMKIDGELVKKFQERLFKGYSAKGEKNFDELCKNMGEYGDELRSQVQGEVVRQTVLEAYFKAHPTNIPPSYVDEQIANMKLYNENMTKTNALIYARATNVWNQLKIGADFKEMAMTYSTLEDERLSGGQWGSLDVRQLSDDPEIITWCKKLSIGEFSPPIEGDNGLMIMRLDSRNADMTDFEISRIFFELPMFMEPAPRDKILAAAYNEYKRGLFSKLMKNLEKKNKPVFYKAK